MKYKKAFTLIELLVVISIIGLLSTIAIVSLNGARARARDVKKMNDVKTIQTALYMFNDKYSGYPYMSGQIREISYITSTTISQPTDRVNFNRQIYEFISVIPRPISSPNSVTCINNFANEYWYRAWYNNVTNSNCSTVSSGRCVFYALQFCLDSQVGGLSAGVHCATPNGILNGACQNDMPH